MELAEINGRLATAEAVRETSRELIAQSRGMRSRVALAVITSRRMRHSARENIESGRCMVRKDEQRPRLRFVEQLSSIGLADHVCADDEVLTQALAAEGRSFGSPELRANLNRLLAQRDNKESRSQR